MCIGMAATYGGSGLKVKLITSVNHAGYEVPVFCARVLAIQQVQHHRARRLPGSAPWRIQCGNEKNMRMTARIMNQSEKPSTIILVYTFCLHEFLTVVAKTQMEALAVHNDRHNYYLTCKTWAENLESARDEIISRWGEMLYRRFRLYLWGSAYAFLGRGMDAYRMVLLRPEDA